jgi:hypothetical protein
MFSFYSTDGTSGRHKMVSQILHLILCIDFHGLGLLHKIFTSLSLLVSDLCTVFVVHVPVFSLRQNLVSSIYVPVVILTWVVQWLRLALSKGPNRVGVSPSPDDRNWSSFPNVVFCSVLEYQMMVKVKKTSNSHFYYVSPFSAYWMTTKWTMYHCILARLMTCLV